MWWNSQQQQKRSRYATLLNYRIPVTLISFSIALWIQKQRSSVADLAVLLALFNQRWIERVMLHNGLFNLFVGAVSFPTYWVSVKCLLFSGEKEQSIASKPNKPLQCIMAEHVINICLPVTNEIRGPITSRSAFPHPCLESTIWA